LALHKWKLAGLCRIHAFVRILKSQRLQVVLTYGIPSMGDKRNAHRIYVGEAALKTETEMCNKSKK
jgi:hypothetical protein